jgi:hypothetical protein
LADSGRAWENCAPALLKASQNLTAVGLGVFGFGAGGRIFVSAGTMTHDVMGTRLSSYPTSTIIGSLFARLSDRRASPRPPLNLELIGAEAKRPNEHPDAMDYILRGRAVRLSLHRRSVCLSMP